MDKKLFCKVVNSIIRQRDMESDLSNLMAKFEPENTFFSLICRDYSESLDDMLLSAIGESGMGWVDWFLYECKDSETGVRSGKCTIDGKETVVQTAEQLYDVIFG